MMGRLRWVSLLMLASIFMLPSGSMAAGRTVIYGPYASDSGDSGTCGVDWQNETLDRVYKVDTSQNADGTFNVREEFKNGVFTTIAGPSPGACESGSNNGNTVPNGLTGTMQGYWLMTVSGGTFNPGAKCALPCYTRDFVATFFGPNATYDVPTFLFNYNAGSNGQWKNASDDRGGDSGDITG